MGAITTRLWPIFVAAALLVLPAVSVYAADTGSISGMVVDQGGQPAAEATIRLSGDLLPIARTALTAANGTYRFDYIVPGDYTIEVDAPGIGAARRAAAVELGKDTQVDLVVGVAVNEQVMVTAATPSVDVRSSGIAFNFRADELNSLPLERTYRGLFQLIPGVADNRSVVGPAAGGSRQDNTYLIDGANITNPSFGYLGTEINELDVAEVNLKRGGVTAEFGRSAGAITNVVSRSGSNRLSGLARMDWLPSSLVAGYALPRDLLDAGVRPGTFRDPLLTTETGPAIGIGGPLRRNRVFFYGSARYSREDKWDRVNTLGAPLPDERRVVGEFFGKVTAVPSTNQLLNVSYRHRPNHVDNATLDSSSAASLATDTRNDAGIGSVAWSYFVTPRTTLNVRYGFSKEKNEDVPVTDLGFQPAFTPANLSAMGQYTDPALAGLKVGGAQFANVQNYRRHEVRATVTRAIDLRGSTHVIKAGGGYEFGEEQFNRIGNGWGAISTINQNGVPALRARYYTPQPSQLGDARTLAMFVQDDLTLGTRLAINAGVLLNRDQFAQHLDGSGGCPAVSLTGGAALYRSSGDTCTFLQFGFADEVQPRLGAAYQLRHGGGDKAYASWGRYYNMDQKSAARSLAPRRIYQTQTIFDLSGQVLSTGPLASTTGKLIDPDLAPTYSDEFIVGYATPLAHRSSLDISFLSRSLHNVIEDVPSRLSGPSPDASPFVAANLPCFRFASCRDAKARRTYRAVTVDLRRQFADGWVADASYTWSRFEGNFDLDYSTSAVFNSSSFIQDGPGTNVQDPNRFGPLLEDRPHVAKLFTSYAAASRLTVSGYLRVQSGTPWAARARDWEGGVLNYLEPAGSHRNPVWTNLDLMASYHLPAVGRANVSLEARLLNVFNAQTRLSTDSQQYLDLRTIPNPPYFDAYQQPNPFFGTGNAFAPPRRLYLALVATF